jgi:hypothetical protein
MGWFSNSVLPQANHEPDMVGAIHDPTLQHLVSFLLNSECGRGRVQAVHFA